jgi:hypothetical protein
MPKKRQHAAAAAADKKKKEKQGPVAVRKVPSLFVLDHLHHSFSRPRPFIFPPPHCLLPPRRLQTLTLGRVLCLRRGGHQLGLHAAGAFLRAPSPGRLPKPPPQWLVRMASGSSASSASHLGPPGLRRSASVQRELQGNMLHLILSQRFPDLAGKLTGMLLELGADEVAEVLADAKLREEALQEALRLLREAGDERALQLDQQDVAIRPPPGRLTVDVSVAQAARAAAENGGGTTGLTPDCSLMRMSPRVSSLYSTRAILGQSGVAPPAGGTESGCL